MRGSRFAAFRLRWMHIGGADLPARRGRRAAIVWKSLLWPLLRAGAMGECDSAGADCRLPARVSGSACTSGADAYGLGRPAEPGGELHEFPRVTFFRAVSRIALARVSPARSSDPKDRAVHDGAGAGGAQYLDEVAERAGLSERDALGALWRFAADGRVTNDSFAPLRMFAADPGRRARVLERSRARPAHRHDAAVRARLKSSIAGRWSIVRAPPAACRCRGMATMPARSRDGAA